MQHLSAADARAVEPGDVLHVAASHDARSIAVRLSPGPTDPTAAPGSPPGTPATAAASASDELHPLAQRCAGAVQALGQQMAKACSQDPLAFRALALAATRLAARPHDAGDVLPGLALGEAVPAAEAARLAAQLFG